MKKLLLLAVAAIIGFGTAIAAPVGVNTAKTLGQKFVQSKFDQTRSADLNLYYTVTSDRGEACAYVFNVGTTGFVIVSASDNVRPILGYSQNGNFDATNPYNGAMYMLETYKNSISYAMEENIAATPEIAEEWESLRNYGRLPGKNRGKVEPLVWTKWNQNSPYNLYAPAASGGPGGRCYAGCVATAMSQVMKYWDHPIQGEGSHSYYCPGYGQQSANFGATTYDWENMPRSLSGANQTQIEAVATLMYHCAVAVNMGFAPDGSGAFSDDVPPAMAQYFDYDYCNKKQRASYSLANWILMLKAEFDLGRPVYYSGQSTEGGHAFVCDGYDEDDLMHFNFGWSGSDDDYYAVDAIDYHTNAAAIFNYVPTAVYLNTAQGPTNVTVTKTSDVAQEATITWTNPTKTINNQNLSAIDQMVVTRDGMVIYAADNATPGESMTFVDENVPCFSTFEYRVYAVVNGVNGTPTAVSESFGPTCEWKIVGTTTNMTGWKSGFLVAYDGAGREIDRFTMTTGNPTTYDMNITLGKVMFKWKPGSDNVALTIKIKDAANNVVYQYDGTSNDIPEGVLYEGNNSCGNAAPAEAPGELFASQDGDNVILTWSGAKTDYGYNIYRDGYLIELTSATEFVDLNPGLGGHCYYVCYLTDGGESPMSNEVCATAGEGCDEGSGLWIEAVPGSGENNYKPMLHWTLPENTEGLSGIFVYRKTNEDGEYERIKILAANKTEYKDAKTMENGNWYYYIIKSYYQDIDCYSAPYKSLYNNEYFVKYYFNEEHTGVVENASNINLYPNPTKDSFTVEGENLVNVMVYNALGQMVYSQECQGNSTVINLGNVETGIYMVKIVTVDGESIQKVSVLR